MSEEHTTGLKKVLFIHHATGIGGALLSLLFLLQKVDRNSFLPKVLCLHDSEAVQVFKDNGIDVEVLNCWRSFSHSEVYWIKWYRPDLLIMAAGAWLVTAYSYAERILRKERPDLVYLNSTPLSAWAVAAKRLNIPVVCHIREPIHAGYLGVRNYVLKRLLKKSVDRFVAVNRQNARTMDAPENTTVIYDFVHFDYFDRTRAPAEIPGTTKKDVKVVLYLGGRATIKGFEVVVEALDYLNPGIVVLFGGPLPSRAWWKVLLRQMLKPRLAEFQRKLNCAPNAVQIGLQKDVAKWIATCDVLINPFTVPHFARPIVEAGAMAKPVIASNVDGMEELVEHGKTGILVPPHNARALAAAINQLCADESLAKQMGEAGFLRAKAIFDGEKNARETFNVFHEILAARDPAPKLTIEECNEPNEAKLIHAKRL
jgi:glycosyltransferase involved in cell wall biosynthesis